MSQGEGLFPKGRKDFSSCFADREDGPRAGRNLPEASGAGGDGGTKQVRWEQG